MLVLIWVQTVCKGYQQMTKVTASKDIVNLVFILYILFQKNPITVVGGEVLLFPRSQICDPPDYWELFQNRRTESTAL